MSLTEDEVRQVLRECVTVVKPGETLVIRLGPDWSPAQMNEVQESLDHAAEWRDLGVKVLVVPGDELGSLSPILPAPVDLAWPPAERAS